MFPLSSCVVGWSGAYLTLLSQSQREKQREKGEKGEGGHLHWPSTMNLYWCLPGGRLMISAKSFSLCDHISDRVPYAALQTKFLDSDANSNANADVQGSH
jgi:hypothetical protein